MQTNPIGLFDSGIGGLTVLKEITRLLPREDTVYVGDTARVPYGTKSAETVTSYSIEIAEFLDEYGVKMLVVGCNTASAYSLEKLRSKLEIPVIGVIEPGARAAIEATRTKKIGVIGTEGTIKSGAYFDAIKRLDDKVVVYTRHCPLFVPLAEEGWIDNRVAIETVALYLSEIKEHGVDALVLGCTHYPLLKKTIQDFMGERVRLIDSAEETALEVQSVLESNGLTRDDSAGVPAERKFFVTDSPERFAEVGARFYDESRISAEVITLGK